MCRHGPEELLGTGALDSAKHAGLVSPASGLTTSDADLRGKTFAFEGGMKDLDELGGLTAVPLS